MVIPRLRIRQVRNIFRKLRDLVHEEYRILSTRLLAAIPRLAKMPLNINVQRWVGI